jgi:hypothetical protein
MPRENATTHQLRCISAHPVLLRTRSTNSHDEDASASTTSDAQISEWIQDDADASVFVITNFCSYASTRVIPKGEHVSSQCFGSAPMQR